MSRSEMADKWGESVVRRGFSQIPHYLLTINQFVDDESKLTPVQSLVLLHLAASWWHKDQMPFPSMATLAKRIGVSERQVQRSITLFEEIGFLKKIKRKKGNIIDSNAYDLGGLVSFLNKVAEAFPTSFPRQLATDGDEV